MNPTWSFKDRLCSVTISKVLEFGSQGIVASSSGNHGASATAYAARAGLPCVAVTLESSPQEVTTSNASLRRLCGRHNPIYGAVGDHGVSHRTGPGMALTNFMAPAVGSIPYGVEGHKTISYEITEQMERCACPIFSSCQPHMLTACLGCGKASWSFTG